MISSPPGILKAPEGCSFTAEGLDSSVTINWDSCKGPVYGSSGLTTARKRIPFLSLWREALADNLFPQELGQ